MKSEQVQVLNYSAHAIEDLHKMEVGYREYAPESAAVLRRLIELLKKSVKFILPNCCDLIDPYELRQAHLDLIRLPFPCVAFEAPWEKNGPDKVGDFDLSPAPKRIALCWEADINYELRQGINWFLDAYPGGGVFVVPIYWDSDARRWAVPLGGAFVPYENELKEVKIEDALPASRIAHEASLAAGLSRPTTKQFQSEPFFLLPEVYAATLNMYHGNKEKADAQIILDTHDEVQTLVQACSVINCSNVTTSEISAPVALNKKRQEKGKQPFFSYKVLQLSDERREIGKGGAGGNHASPRMHLRRGHLRRLESKVVWVRPAMVNAGSAAGVVLKDYAVHPKG